MQHDVDNADRCQHCGAEDRWDHPVCLTCGESLVIEDIRSIHRRKVLMREHYKTCYNFLHDYAKQPYPLNDTQWGRYPTSRSRTPGTDDLRLIGTLQRPKDISPLDIVTFADSIIRYKLECFKWVLLDNDELLEDFVRKNILQGLNRERLCRLYDISDIWPMSFLSKLSSYRCNH